MANRQIVRMLYGSARLFTPRYLHRYAEKNCLPKRKCLPLFCKTQFGGFHSSNVMHNKASIINIQDEDDFKERVLKNTTPVIVDFHANWCGPCKLLGPRLETLVGVKNNEVEEVILAKVDIDEMPDIAMEYGVEAVPTVVSMKEGKVTNKFIGLKEDDEIETFIRKLIE